MGAMSCRLFVINCFYSGYIYIYTFRIDRRTYIYIYVFLKIHIYVNIFLNPCPGLTKNIQLSSLSQNVLECSGATPHVLGVTAGI